MGLCLYLYKKVFQPTFRYRSTEKLVNKHNSYSCTTFMHMLQRLQSVALGLSLREIRLMVVVVVIVVVLVGVVVVVSVAVVAVVVVVLFREASLFI